MPRASSLQATLKKRFGVDAELIAGHNGTFLVRAEGKVIFDKLQVGRFPEEQEVVDSIAKLAT